MAFMGAQHPWVSGSARNLHHLATFCDPNCSATTPEPADLLAPSYKLVDEPQ